MGGKVQEIEDWFDNLPVVDANGQPSTCIPYGGNPRVSEPLSGTCCNQAAAESILSKLKEVSVQTILISWEHINIQWLAHSLGAPKDKVVNAFCPDRKCWPDEKYNIIYALHYNKYGQFLDIETNLDQGFEWIGPSAGSCGIIATE